MGLSDNQSDIKEPDEKIKVLYNEFKSSWDILKVKFLDLTVLVNVSTDEGIKQFSTGHIQESRD